MPDIASVLKEEIVRLARKEVRNQLKESAKNAGGSKGEITALKREIAAVKRELAQVQKAQGKTPKAAAPAAKVGKKAKVAKASKAPKAASASSTSRRFSPAGVRKHREKLGFSAADYAKLVGVSSLTIYNWEHGKSRPREAQLESLAAVRDFGKREALAKIGKGE